MNAQEIWQQDILEREAGASMPRQQYYASLRDALYQELMRQGYSDLLEQLLLDLRGGDLEKVYVVDYAALMECHSMIVLGRDMRDATEFVPHLHLRGEKAAWSVLERPGSFLMPVGRDMTEKLKQLRAVSRQLVDARDDTVIPQADDAAQREIEQVHTLNKLLDDRCRALQAERDELQQRLRLLEEGVITEQVRYAIEARRIQEEEALRLSYEGQKAAAREAFRVQFAKAQEEDRLSQEERARALSALHGEIADDYAAVRQSMAGDLRQLTALLEARTAAWAHALDRVECRMLAQSYVALYQLLTVGVDKVVLDAQCTGADAAVLTALAELQQQFRDRLRQLEQAMARLGLVIIRPAAGEAFQGAYHLPAGSSAGVAEGAQIIRCVTPGVMAKDAQEALLRAEVETE